MGGVYKMDKKTKDFAVRRLENASLYLIEKRGLISLRNQDEWQDTQDAIIKIEELIREFKNEV